MRQIFVLWKDPAGCGGVMEEERRLSQVCGWFDLRRRQRGWGGGMTVKWEEGD